MNYKILAIILLLVVFAYRQVLVFLEFSHPSLSQRITAI